MCIAILDHTFLEAYLIHIRRKHFFNARKKEGQSAIEFREELLSLLEEVDSVNITCNDLICMMLQIDLSDPSLQRELGSVHNPTLDAFNKKIKGFEQARRTVSGNAYGNAVTRHNMNSGRKASNQPGRSTSKNQPNRNKGERDRRLTLRGKCFRCAYPDHMIPQCTYPKTVKCNLCGALGHVTPACSRRQSAQMVQHNQIPQQTSSSVQNSQQLAIAYDGDSHLTHDGSESAWPLPSSASSGSSSNTCAGAFYTPSNLPTPEMPL